MDNISEFLGKTFSIGDHFKISVGTILVTIIILLLTALALKMIRKVVTR